MSDLDQDPGGIQAVFLDGVVRRCLVLDILGVNIGALTFCIRLCLTSSSSTCTGVTHVTHVVMVSVLLTSNWPFCSMGGAAPGHQVLHHLGRAVPRTCEVLVKYE